MIQLNKYAKKHIKKGCLMVAFFISFILFSKLNAQNTDVCLKQLLELKLTDASFSIQHFSASTDRLYFQHYYSFLLQMVYHQPYDDYKAKFDSLETQITKTNMPLWQLSEIYLQKGVIEYINNHFYTAIKSFNKAYTIWQDSEKEKSDINNLKLKGIFNLLLAHLPIPYKNWAEWIGFKGDTKEGFHALFEYYNLEKTEGKNLEAKLYLAFAMLKFMPDDSMIEVFLHQEVEKDNPDFLKAILIRCSFKIRKPDICSSLFQSVNNDSFNQLHYLKGKYLVQKASLKSIAELSVFIQKAKDNTFLADAYRYLTWIYILQDNIQSGRFCLEKLKKINDYPTWEDKQAYYESKLDYGQSKILLRSRLLFDRGEYHECILLLTENRNEFINKDAFSVEYNYRIGRAYQMYNKYESAIYHYNKAIELQEFSDRYFPPESAINIAKIEIQRGHYKKAENALDMAKKINTGENRTFINQDIKLLSEIINNKTE